MLICTTHRAVKANNKYMKDYNPSTESSYLTYWDVNNLYGWARSQKLPVVRFKWRNDKFNFYKDFIESYTFFMRKPFFCQNLNFLNIS